MLGTDIDEIRAAKANGCPAFRSGRVYRKELLDWFEEKQRHKETAASNDDQSKKRLQVGACAILELMKCPNADLLTDDQFFDIGKTIVEAVDDKEMLKHFIDAEFKWLFRTFWTDGQSKEDAVLAAYNAHPKIVKWLFQAYAANELHAPPPPT